MDPHGLHHGGLSGGGNPDRIEALKELEEVSKETVFRKKNLALGGWLLTSSKLNEIPGAEGKDWETLERDHKIMRQAGDYVRKILTPR